MWIAVDIMPLNATARIAFSASGYCRRRTTRPLKPMLRSPCAGVMRALIALVLLISLAACGAFSDQRSSPGSEASLRSNLSVASAAMAAGRPEVARRLYQTLAEHFKEAPEPVLGLGNVALQANDFDAASNYFLDAAKLAGDSPATKAEALLGAGRAALARGDGRTARKHLRQARKLARDPSSAVWVENGLAVAAMLDGDYRTSETHYAAALRLSSEHPGITANYVRMLIASGRLEEAKRIYREHDSSYWVAGEEVALQRLIEEAGDERTDTRSSHLLDRRLLLEWPATYSLQPLRSEEARSAIRLELGGSLGLALRRADASVGAMPLAAANAGSGGPDVPLSDATPRESEPFPRTSSSLDPAVPQSRPTARLSEGISHAGTRPFSDPEPGVPPLHLAGSERSLFAPRESRVLNGWEVLLGRSRQWRLDSAAEAVAAASPEIADVQLLAPDVLYVIGKNVGSTSISVLSESGLVQKRDVSVVLDVEPFRALLARDPDLRGVNVQPLARGVALTGEVGSAAAAGRALQLAAASFPEDMLVENGLRVGLDLEPLRAIMIRQSGLHRVRVQRLARGIALTGDVDSESAAERAHRLALASLPEGTLVENNLRIQLDVEPLRALLAGDPELHDVSVTALARGVALGGEVGSAAAADLALRFAAASLPEDTLIENNLGISGPQQVNLEVQIAEVQRSVAEDFGFNWEVFGHSNDPLGFGFRIGRGLPDDYRLAGPERIAGQPHPSLPPGPGIPDPGEAIELGIPPTIVEGVPSPTFVFQRAWDNIGITGMVDALARAGLANVLARPNLTAVSGETASFFSGGEYPLPTGFDDGVIVFEYKKYGVLLDFVPTIIDETRIELTVRPEVSEPSQNRSVQVVAGVNVPVINVRRAETTVEMGDGESIVIAGLFRNRSNEVESGVPLLKDLPVLGAAFGHTSSRSDELELIVTVTARLVQSGPAPDTNMTASGRTDDYYY